MSRRAKISAGRRHGLFPSNASLAVAIAANSVTVGAAWAQGDDLKAFPSAEPGMQRVVVRVPEVPVPDDKRVEVIVGQSLEVDCNRQRLLARVTRKVAQGWGYDYYVVSDVKGPASTMRACPPGSSTRMAFVAANAPELSSLSYNHRLPIVIYVPAGIEVRYRVWSAPATTERGVVE